MFAQILRKPAQLRLTNWGGKDGSGEVLRRATQLTSTRDCSADSMLLLKEGNWEKTKLKIHHLQILTTQREKVQMTPFRDRREKACWGQSRGLGQSLLHLKTSWGQEQWKMERLWVETQPSDPAHNLPHLLIQKPAGISQQNTLGGFFNMIFFLKKKKFLSVLLCHDRV